ATMRELARVIRPGGRIASLEFGVPPWPPARAAWRLYTRVGLPILGRLVSRDWGAVGRFLGPSIAGFYARHPLERITGYWRAGGGARGWARPADERGRGRGDVGEEAPRRAGRGGRRRRERGRGCGPRLSGPPSTRSAAARWGTC